MRNVKESARFFYQCGAYGAERYGKYLACVDFSAAGYFGDEYLGIRIAEQHERYLRELDCWGYVGECLRALTRGAMPYRLYDILTGNIKPEISAEEAESAMLSEFKRIGGE